MGRKPLNIEYFALADFGVLSAEGTDAGKFLQGQLSNDVASLATGQSQLSALHTVQGRVQAVIYLLCLGEASYTAVLPQELLPAVLATLQQRVFRAKVTLRDAVEHWQVLGATAAPPNSWHAAVDRSARCFVLLDATRPDRPTPLHSREAWRALDIAAGLPQVYARSQGEFVAQMLNLDLLGGIAFDKGCYIGQEIVARSHYRGRVKRRLQRFAYTADTAPLPGDSVLLASGATAQVVDATRAAGQQQLLAVTAIGATGALPMPYELPRD